MKKKILFLIHTLQVGGAEKVLVNLVNKLDKKKYDVTVMTVINTGAFREALDKDIKYKTIIDIKMPGKKTKNKSGNLLNKTSKVKQMMANLYRWAWRYVNCEKIYKKFIKEDYDVEVAFLEGISAKIIANSTNKHAKKIAWIHVDLLNEKKTEKFFKSREDEANTYKKFSKIIGVSKFVREQTIKKFDLDPNKVGVLYNPIDRESIVEKSKEQIEQIEKENFTLCTIGRLSTQKGFDRLLEAVKRLNEENIKFDLWIIGVGAEEEKLKTYINENNLNNVKMLGYKENPYSYIAKSDLFVCSSRAEGFSTSVSEAIILERPVVTTECSGMRELLGENSEYGIICENNTEALYQSLQDILTNKEKYEYYKNKIIERKNIFDIKKSIKDIENLFEE